MLAGYFISKASSRQILSKKIPLSNKLTFSVHGYSNRWFEPFVVHQTFDGHVLQQPWLDSQCAYDQGGPVALWKVGRHRGAHGAIIPLHIPHYLYWGAWHWGAVGFDHTRGGSLVAHLRFGQHCVEQSETDWALVDIYTPICSFCNEPCIIVSSIVFLCCVLDVQPNKFWKRLCVMFKQWIMENTLWDDYHSDPKSWLEYRLYFVLRIIIFG